MAHPGSRRERPATRELALGAYSSLRAGGLLRRCAGLGGPMLRSRTQCAVVGMQQIVVHRIAGRSRRVLQTQPVHHLESMFFDGLDTAPEISGNPLAGISQRNAYQHLTFARRHFSNLRLGGLRSRMLLPADGVQWQRAMFIFRSLRADRTKQDLEWRMF